MAVDLHVAFIEQFEVLELSLDFLGDLVMDVAGNLAAAGKEHRPVGPDDTWSASEFACGSAVHPLGTFSE
jgi:hypothetical protein